MSKSLWPHGLWPTRLLWPWDSPGKDTGVGFHFLLEEIFPTPRSNLCHLHDRQTDYPQSHQGSPRVIQAMHVCMLSRFSCVQLFVIPWTVVRQAPLSMGFSRQEHWSGLLSPPQGIFWLRDFTLVSYIPCTGTGSLPLAPLGEPPVAVIWRSKYCRNQPVTRIPT